MLFYVLNEDTDMDNALSMSSLVQLTSNSYLTDKV